jgi:hypothetical protein
MAKAASLSCTMCWMEEVCPEPTESVKKPPPEGMPRVMAQPGFDRYVTASPVGAMTVTRTTLSPFLRRKLMRRSAPARSQMPERWRMVPMPLSVACVKSQCHCILPVLFW